MPTVSALALELCSEAGESTSDTEYLTLVRKWIKGGFREIGDISQWYFLKKDETFDLSVLGGAEYPTQASATEVTKIRFTETNEKITYIPVERLIERGIDLELPGKPQHFWQSGFDESTNEHLFTVWPVPDATYEVQVIENGMARTLADGDTIPMPENFLTILEDYTRAMQAMDDKDYEKYDRLEKKWREALAERMRRYNKQPSQRRRLRVTDIGPNSNDLPMVRLDPNHFSN